MGRIRKKKDVPSHKHDYQIVGYDGAGRQILQCWCGATITGI